MLELRRAAPRQLETCLVDQRHGAAADDVGWLLAAEQVGRLLVGEDDHSVAVDVHRVGRGLDQGAVALLALAQSGIRIALSGNVENGSGRPGKLAVGIEEHAPGRCHPPFRTIVGAADAKLGLIPTVTGRIMSRAVTLVHPVAVIGMDQGGKQLGIGWGRGIEPADSAKLARTSGASR